VNIAWFWLRAAVGHWLSDRATTMGAAIAFYGLSSIVPIFALIGGVTALLLGEQAVEGAILIRLGAFIGADGAALILNAMHAVRQADGGALTITIAVITLAFTATGMLAEIRESLNVIFGGPEVKRPGWLVWLVGRLLSGALIAAFGALLLASMAISAVLAMLGTFLRDVLPIAEHALQWLTQAISFLMTAIFFRRRLRHPAQPPPAAAATRGRRPERQPAVHGGKVRRWPVSWLRGP
jgi:membrane protein